MEWDNNAPANCFLGHWTQEGGERWVVMAVMEIYTPMWRNYGAEYGQNLKWTAGFSVNRGLKYGARVFSKAKGWD